MDSELNIVLSEEEAIVLFEYLARVSEKNILSESFEDKSEERVLWNLEAILEKQLEAPFKSNYEEIIKKARATVMAKIEVS